MPMQKPGRRRELGQDAVYRSQHYGTGSVPAQDLGVDMSTAPVAGGAVRRRQ